MLQSGVVTCGNFAMLPGIYNSALLTEGVCFRKGSPSVKLGIRDG